MASMVVLQLEDKKGIILLKIHKGQEEMFLKKMNTYLSRVALASLSSDFRSCVSKPSMKLPLPS